MNKQSLPLKRTVAYRKNISIKVEDEVKTHEATLKDLGYDTAEILRSAVRRALKDAIDELKPKRAA